MSETAMQTRCVACGREQYGPAVYGISTNNEPCVWCGDVPGTMTDEEWREKLRKLRNKND